jgi:hypothetical protein
MGRLRAFAFATLLAMAGSEVRQAFAAKADTPPAGGSAVESLQVQSTRLLALSKLQHAAEREVQLALVGQAGGSRPETKRYAAELESDFRAMSDRIGKVAATMQIEPERLRRLFAGENTAALRRESEDLDRLGKLRGDAFDQQFWIVVTHQQMAAADMLGTLAGTDPSTDSLVAEMALRLERASGNAVVAAKAVTASAGRVVPASSPPPAAQKPAPSPAPPAEEPADEPAPSEGPPAADTPAPAKR